MFVTSLEKDGTLVTLPNGKGKATVMIGSMQMEVDTKYLTYSTKKKEDNVSTATVHRAHATVSTSIDVRGQLAEEAVINVDMYLDLAFGRNLKTVTVIHGKGTGALKNAIWQYLRDNKRVKSFRLGAYGEGDAGVTIIEFK